MEAAAKARGIEAKIWALSEQSVHTAEGEFDCLLVGPQIRYKLNDLKKAYGDKVPVSMIDMKDYGRMDGEAVLDLALGLLGQK